MAVVKRNGAFFIYFYPFKTKKIGLKLPDVPNKTEAKRVEAVILKACRSGIYSGLDADSREACIRMFQNQRWEMPPDLGGVPGLRGSPREKLTLWRASELFLKAPEIKDNPARWRYEAAFLHLVERLGKDRDLKSIWVPDLKAYQIERLNEGAAPATVNREFSALSRLIGIMIEHQLVEQNPVRLVKPLSEKSGERQVYLNRADVEKIAGKCPSWFPPIIWTAFYTGMRRGETLGLTRRRVDLPKRMIYLGPEDTKEGHWKRVPIHRDLLPILMNVLHGPALISGRVFPFQDMGGIHELRLETFKNPWERACEALRKEEREKAVSGRRPKWEKPWPRFHDLRHTWRTNARRSGVDPQIAESIMGHWFKGKSVNDRYGYISDEELVAAIDKMTFDHGNTVILVVNASEKASRENGNSIVTETVPQKKRSRGHVT